MRFNVVKTLIIEAEMVLVHRTRIQVIFSELIRIFLTVPSKMERQNTTTCNNIRRIIVLSFFSTSGVVNCSSKDRKREIESD